LLSDLKNLEELRGRLREKLILRDCWRRLREKLILRDCWRRLREKLRSEVMVRVREIGTGRCYHLQKARRTDFHLLTEIAKHWGKRLKRAMTKGFD
jgi:hypothetical protein